MKKGIPTSWNGNHSPSDGATVTAALSRVSLHNLGLSGMTCPSEEMIEEMIYLLNAYCEQLLIIGQAHTISKNKAIHVSEAELVSGTITTTWSDHQRQKNAVAAMNLQVSIIPNPCYGFLDAVSRHMSSFVGSGKNFREKTRRHQRRQRLRKRRIMRIGPSMKSQNSE
jgi:hypothetical protein